jgi:hypothetical protein
MVKIYWEIKHIHNVDKDIVLLKFNYSINKR